MKYYFVSSDEGIPKLFPSYERNVVTTWDGNGKNRFLAEIGILVQTTDEKDNSSRLSPRTICNAAQTPNQYTIN